jgi:hypothetical protein
MRRERTFEGGLRSVGSKMLCVALAQLCPQLAWTTDVAGEGATLGAPNHFDRLSLSLSVQYFKTSAGQGWKLEKGSALRTGA